MREERHEFEYGERVVHKDGWLGKIVSINWMNRHAEVCGIGNDNHGYPTFDEMTHADMCKCGKNPASPPHACPYADEIHGDDESLCTCCEDCEHECCMDI